MKKIIFFIFPALLLAYVANAQATDSTQVIFTIVEKMPQFPGGEIGLAEYLEKNIVYPDTALQHGIQGKLYITFLIDELGNVTKPKIIRGIGGGCDEEAIRVIQAMPRWTPGMQNGRAVKVQYNLPIRFTMPKSHWGVQAQGDLTGMLLTNRMKLAEFPGGDEALFAYLEKNIVYPADARKKGLQGKAFLSFTVDPSGQVTNVKAIEPLFSSLAMDKETLNAIKEMPKWQPGTQEGKRVPVTFHLSITY